MEVGGQQGTEGLKRYNALRNIVCPSPVHAHPWNDDLASDNGFVFENVQPLLAPTLSVAFPDAGDHLLCRPVKLAS